MARSSVTTVRRDFGHSHDVLRHQFGSRIPGPNPSAQAPLVFAIDLMATAHALLSMANRNRTLRDWAAMSAPASCSFSPFSVSG